MSDPIFDRYIGIDYSGAATPTSSLKGLRVYLGDRSSSPAEVSPPPSPRKYWTRRGVAEWLLERLAEEPRTVAGIDHAFSFPVHYFEKHGLVPDWDTFLDDFQQHWPTDGEHVYVDFVRDGSVGNGAARSGSTRWKRLTDKRSGSAKSVFHFDVQGSVAKSTHSGIPWLRTLRRTLGDRLHFWPFDGWHIPDGKSVVAEAYPALWNQDFPREERTPDQHDAYSVARWLREADFDGGLLRHFDPPLTPSERAIAEVEGWILGVLDDRRKKSRGARKPRRRQPPRVAPPSPFHRNGQPLPFSKLDFWRWAFDDLSGNTLRGIVAEFLVAQALGAVLEPRREWDSVDLRTPRGLTVEVKSSAYVQSWRQDRPSQIRFSVAPRAAWDAMTNNWDRERRRRADVYVFALLAHEDKATLDPLNVEQWVFWILPAARLNQKLGEQKSIGLGTLESLGAKETGFGGLSTAFRELLQA